jgi:hypothetical protein
VTEGQLRFEAAHLQAKVTARDAGWLPRLPDAPIAAPSFVVVPGGIESWERPSLAVP